MTIMVIANCQLPIEIIVDCRSPIANPVARFDGHLPVTGPVFLTYFDALRGVDILIMEARNRGVFSNRQLGIGNRQCQKPFNLAQNRKLIEGSV